MKPLHCGVSQNSEVEDIKPQGQANQDHIIFETTSIQMALLIFCHLFVVSDYMSQFVSVSFHLLVLLDNSHSNPTLQKLVLLIWSLLVKIVFHVQQIMRLLLRSLDTGSSFRGQLMEVKSALTRCMKRETVNQFLYVQFTGKNIIFSKCQFHKISVK